MQMKQLLSILFALLILTSCREDKVFDEPVSNPYGVVFTNDTNGQIYVSSDQLVMGMCDIEPGKHSDAIYGSRANVTVTYFGEGTYFKKIEKSYILEKDKTIAVSLTYP